MFFARVTRYHFAMEGVSEDVFALNGSVQRFAEPLVLAVAFCRAALLHETSQLSGVSFLLPEREIRYRAPATRVLPRERPLWP